MDPKDAVRREPAVAVVMTCRERLPFTRLTLPLAVAHAGMAADWYVIDDGSTDGTGAWLDDNARKLRIEVAHNPKPLGVGPIRNMGFRWAIALGADVVINLDNDDLVPLNWLRDFVAAFWHSRYSICMAYRPNNATLVRVVQEAAGNTRRLPRDAFVEVERCGGACVAHRVSMIRDGVWYDANRPPFEGTDSSFNGLARRKGYLIGVYCGVQVFDLEQIYHCSPEYERQKAEVRHVAMNKGPDIDRAYPQARRGTLE